MVCSEVVATGAVAALGIILLVLLHQCFRLHELWQVALGCQKSQRWVQIWEAENRELRSALRAEKAQIEQLQRKLVILQELIPAAG
ncbi:hypothetical protein [Pseudomonas putida]